MDITLILYLLFIHWVGDFLFQTFEMGTLKSSSNEWLTIHVSVYTLSWFVLLGFITPFVQTFLFCIITFITHWITDYYTSRWTKKLREKEKYYGFPAFFNVIGLDQWLHYVQIFLTYKYIVR